MSAERVGAASPERHQAPGLRNGQPGEEWKVQPSPEAKETSAPKSPSKRLQSLDAFRGLTILGMLLVNNVALDTATPRQLTHAPWNQGVTFADLVFPWFLLIVGIAIPYSAASVRAKGLPHWRYDLKVLGRAVTLVLLGCLIDSSMLKRPTFDLGVLQLIGLSYIVGALLYDLPLTRRLLVAAALLAAHWAAIRFVPIPGVGAGVFTEDQNLIYHLNRVYLQPIFLRGLISLVPMGALVLIGSALGDGLRRESLGPVYKVAQLLIAGLALTGIGWLWSFDLPFNKPVWSASYVVYAAGLGALLLGTLYLLIDVTGWRAWALPLIVPGANAIVAYVAPILVKLLILDAWKWKMPDGSLLPLSQAILHYCFVHAGRIRGGWLYTWGYVLFWWLILLRLYRKRVFVRV
jgi:predicted acyltransferase